MIHSSVLMGMLLVGVAEPDVAADEAILRGASIRPDGAGLVEFLQSRVARSQADEKRIEELIAKMASGKFREREKATSSLIAIGQPAKSALVRAANTKDLDLIRRVQQCLDAIEKANQPDIEMAALRVLRVRKPEGAARALLNFLPSVREASHIEEALTTLLAVGVHEGRIEDAIVDAIKDKSAPRRAAAALVLGHSGSAKQKEIVRQLAKGEADPMVRLRAVQGLIAGKDRSAVALLFPLMTEAPFDLASQARELLAILASEQGPALEMTDDRASRQGCREAWEKWWKEGERQIDFSRIEAGLPWQGMNQRASKTVLAFYESLYNGRFEEFQRLTAAPFTVSGIRVLTTREQIDSMLGRTVKLGPRPRTVKYAVSRVGDIKEYLQDNDRPQMREFLKLHGNDTLKVVYLTSTSSTGRQTMISAFVRFRGGQAHVVGMGPTRRR